MAFKQIPEPEEEPVSPRASRAEGNRKRKVFNLPEDHATCLAAELDSE